MRFQTALSIVAALAPAVFGQLLEGTAVGPTTALSAKSTICNVLDYGGVADGATDIGPAITKAFACVTAAKNGATLYVPEGNYLISTGVVLNAGSNWAFQLDGLITLDVEGSFSGNAIVIKRATNLEMYSSNGKGAIQGNGYQVRISGSSQNARLLRFMNCTNYSVHDLFLIDSPTFHLIHNNAVNMETYHITIRGGNKGGLDGLDLICDSNCYLHHIEVTNRDECISVKTPSKNVLIEDIYCNQSGGMSIGSLDAGSGGSEIEYIHMRRINVYQCTQMLMIKTWPGGTGAVGYVRNSIFEDFWAYDTTYALDIDQYWYSHTTPNTGAIALSGLVFSNWTGTVNNGINRGPIVIKGSDVVPLTNITLEDFSMWTVNKDRVVLQCNNVYGTGYCARELASGATPTAFSSTVTITTTMSGFTSPTSPAWGVAGYGTTESIPVYTPAALWGTVAAAEVAAREVTSTAVAATTSTKAATSTQAATSTKATSTAAAATTLVTKKATSTLSSASATITATTIRTRGGPGGRGGPW
ncbi:pectin lyase fold/virulence factor [Morchella snyderi]|nr:pectin lyase fold/virulence factor [Morchella snyderi]